MRFNDLLRTVFANNAEGANATVTRWRQCVDIIAQYDVSGGKSGIALLGDDLHAMLELIDDMRARVPTDQRIASIVELGSRLRSPGLVRLLSQDHPSLVVAMMTHVRLIDADWANIIPELGPLARSVLRRRTDLGPMATMALRRFGETDLALPSSVLPQLQRWEQLGDDDMLEGGNRESSTSAQQTPLDRRAADTPSQIEAIVARIERFAERRANRTSSEPQGSLASDETGEGAQSSRGDQSIAEPQDESAITAGDEFLFETDASGVIQVAGSTPRGASLGLSIAAPAIDSRLGADGTALGAFRRRAAFENARFTIGEGLLEGEWRISADPQFDRMSGRFLGYAGSARREYPHESLVKSADEVPQGGWAGLSASSTRQLIHELRTPLNAIQGYSEMIEVQMLGPVAESYREMARTIMKDARALLATFDDLDSASRIERGDTAGASQAVDLGATLSAIVGTFQLAGQQRLTIEGADISPMIMADRGQIERMLTHLVRAGCIALDADERLELRLASNADGSCINLTMTRPAALQGVGEQDLMDHGYVIDQKLREPPLLGLAFTLKLVSGIAKHLGGRFEITPTRFALSLPTATLSQSGQEGTR